jgi:hypothetical protein
MDHTMNRFTEIHKALRQNASESAALAVHNLIEKNEK